jgi:hypothetical protein
MRGGVEMKSVSCIVFFDLLGDTVHEKERCNHCWKVWSREHPGIAKQVTWTFTDDPVMLHECIPTADFVFFDYGGLCMPGHESLGLSFARELEKHVIDRPSVEFILLCTMGKDWYKEDYTEEYPNLHFEDVDWYALFDKYVGGSNA